MTTGSYQNSEVVLYGSIDKGSLDQLLHRLYGLCDQSGPVKFTEHNLCFKFTSMQIHHIL